MTGWKADGRSVFVYQPTPMQVQIDQIDVASGDRRSAWKTVRPLSAAVTGLNGRSWQSPDGALAYDISPGPQPVVRDQGAEVSGPRESRRSPSRGLAVIGTTLGPYQVLAKLGEGGMGEVYRARDGKLKRDVAIKVLPASLSADAARLARFQREAEVLASLNDPHIAAIYGLEEQDGQTALVLELVEGPTLADRIAQGAIPADEALPIAHQIALALEAAHDAGIIHRDLKPANVKVRPDGVVKVLDFGLADWSLATRRASPRTGQDVSNSPTFASPAMTAMGMILGTAAYMAPEQARGRFVDKRVDIWAFGLVLYEMLTGRAAFAGDTITDILAAVVTREPDWTALPATTPASIRRLLTRCVEKDPKRRLRDIGDAQLEIEEAIARGSSCGNALAIRWRVRRGMPARPGFRNSAGQRPVSRWRPLAWSPSPCPGSGHGRGRPTRARCACPSSTRTATKSPRPRSRPTAGASRTGRDEATACRCSGCATWRAASRRPSLAPRMP